MKAGREHRVPLVSEPLSVLSEAAEYGDPSDPAAFVFPSAKGGDLGPWQLSKLVSGLDLGGTLHGFRSTFRDWAADQSVPERSPSCAWLIGSGRQPSKPTREAMFSSGAVRSWRPGHNTSPASQVASWVGSGGLGADLCRRTRRCGGHSMHRFTTLRHMRSQGVELVGDRIQWGR